MQNRILGRLHDMSTLVQIVVGVVAFAVFFLPIYLPFAVTFAMKSREWRGFKWSLRISSVPSLFFSIIAIGSRPDYGNDVGGNLAGAIHNFAWVWGTGIFCTVVGLVVGAGVRFVRTKMRRSNQESHERSTPS